MKPARVNVKITICTATLGRDKASKRDGKWLELINFYADIYTFYV